MLRRRLTCSIIIFIASTPVSERFLLHPRHLQHPIEQRHGGAGHGDTLGREAGHVGRLNTLIMFVPAIIPNNKSYSLLRSNAARIFTSPEKYGGCGLHACSFLLQHFVHKLSADGAKRPNTGVTVFLWIPFPTSCTRTNNASLYVY